MKKQIFNLKGLFDVMNKKKDFFLKIFSNLIFQILVTFVIFYNVKTDMLNNNLILLSLILVQFGIIFVFSFLNLSQFMKFLLMTLFSSIWGFIFISLKNHVPPEVIKTAIYGALGIFVGFFIFGLLLYAFGVYLDFRFGLILLGLLLLLIITNIVLFIMNKYNGAHKFMAIISIILFSLFIIYDTNNILYDDSKNAIGASMNYYLDIINIFLNIVSYQN
jgi:modulator of FtsH protease